MAGRRKGKGPRKFYSKAQWRWAFATHQPWAHRQAHRTPGGKKVRFRRLPGHSGRAVRSRRGSRRMP